MALPEFSIITDLFSTVIDMLTTNYLVAGSVIIVIVIAVIAAFLIFRMRRKKPAIPEPPLLPDAPSPPPEGMSPRTHAFAPQEKSTLPFYQKKPPGFDDLRKVEAMMEIVSDLEKHFYSVQPDELGPDEKKWYDKIKKGIENVKVALDYGEIEMARRSISSLEMHTKMLDMTVHHKNS